MDRQHGKLNLFQKLGYNDQDIKSVLEKLGEEAIDDDILKELIMIDERSKVETDVASPKISIPWLVARGCNMVEENEQRNKIKEESTQPSSNLRPIVIDGSNVAMCHGYMKLFSCKGIDLAVDWFRQRGHAFIKVFVPLWRKEQSRSYIPISDPHILDELENKLILVYTPSRKFDGKRIACYDDRYIVKLAYEKDAVIVSNNNYRDLLSEKVEWKQFIEKRLLMYYFVNDKFMPPDNPLGRHGPTLSNFLRIRPSPSDPEREYCPYGIKCTYGMKSKFYHPKRLNPQQLSIADELRAKTKTVLIKSEKDNELVKKGHAMVNPVYSFPSGCKWPEQDQRAKETSPSFQINQKQCFQQKRQLECSAVAEWTGSSNPQDNSALYRDLNSMEDTFSAMYVTKSTYPQTDIEKKKRRRELHHCCGYNHDKNNYIPIPYTHRMNCTHIKQHYIPVNFM